MKLSQIGITILTVGTIIVSGCAVDDSVTSETPIDNAIDSPLVEFGDSGAGLVRHSNTSIETTFRNLSANKTTTPKRHGWLISCSADCRSEAAEARNQCYEDKALGCQREAQDVFDTCFQYECQNGGKDRNKAFGHPIPSVEDAGDEEGDENIVTPSFACQKACAKDANENYLQCLKETKGQVPVRCRDVAETAVLICVRTHCSDE